ncbi:HD domain-containing protein [Pseudolysinimonas sp.]
MIERLRARDAASVLRSVAMTESSSTRLARDIRSHIPPRADVLGFVELPASDALVWEAAVSFLGVRNNDRHTIYAYAMARALLDLLPNADAEVVRSAILLHDVGWSTVAERDVLEAIAPGGGRHELVRQHEVEGATIARAVLTNLGRRSEVVDEVCSIIDGHDTRSAPISLEDSIVKDADKLWRITPDGLDVIRGWFQLSDDETLRLVCARVHESLFTEEARAIARGFAASAAIDLAPQRVRLPDRSASLR